MLHHRVLIHCIGKGCPKAYSYAYADKGKSTHTELTLSEAEIARPTDALFTCNKKPNYTLTFCPK